METKVMKAGKGSLALAVEMLRMGELVIFPSDNIYGMLVAAGNPAAVAKIYELKGRDEAKPLGFMTNREQAERWGVFQDQAREVLEYWPCGLTVIVPKDPSVPDYITKGYNSILLSCPDNTCAALVAQADFPIACTSANKSGEVAVSSCAEAVEIFGGQVPLIIDGGESLRKSAGTIIDFSRTPPTVLRIGAFSLETLRQALPNMVVADRLI
jgi:L-threonylcarbamoyladenylate synthase